MDFGKCLKIAIFKKKTTSQIMYQWMDSSANLANYNSRNSTVHNDSQTSLVIQQCSKFTLWPLPGRAVSYLHSYTWGWKEIM